MKNLNSYGWAIPIIIFLLVSNCFSQVTRRNITESISVVNKGKEINKDNIVFILHLEKDMQKLTFREAEDLKDNSNAYSSSLISAIKNAIGKIDATLNKATADPEPIKITFISGENNWSNDNVVAYIPSKSGYLILTSMEDIKKAVYSSNPYFLDDKTISSVQQMLMDARKQDKDFDEFCLEYETKEYTNKALAIMEAELRKLKVVEKGPLLQNDTSPKINNAIKDPFVLHELENSKDSTVSWAFSYLSKKKIITKE